MMSNLNVNALKLIKPEIAHNEKGWKRFRREARLMAKLNHPNAVAVHSFKRAHSMGYIEMEFVRGKSLDKYLSERGGEQIPLDRIVSILDQLCAVLHEAHGHVDEKTGKPTPIIHRDLKPSNIMLVERKPPSQDLKVLDFGIAKMLEEDGGPDATLTGGRRLPGHSRLLESGTDPRRVGQGRPARGGCPERSVLGRCFALPVDHRQAAVPGTGHARALMAANLAEQPRPMKEANPQVSVPPAVERVVMQCLEKDPAKRPQTAEELARLFRSAAGLSRPRRSVWLGVGAVCVGTCLLGVLGLALRPHTRDKPPLEPAPQPAPVSQAATPWLPDGYKPGESSPLDEGSGEYQEIVRKADGAGIPAVRKGDLPARRLRTRDGELGPQFRGLAARHPPQAGERPLHPDPRRDLPSR